MRSGIKVNGAVKTVLLVGGGHSHALVLRQWAKRPPGNSSIILIDPNDSLIYSGMLPGVLAGHFAPASVEIDLRKLAGRAGATFVQQEATSLNTFEKTLQLSNGTTLRYDVVSLDIGARYAPAGLPDFDRNGTAAKPFGPLLQRWETLLEQRRDVAVTILGGGVAGAEVAMAMAFRLNALGRRYVVNLIDRSRALREVAPATRRRIFDAFDELGVKVHENAITQGIADGHVELASGVQIASDLTVSATGASAHEWPERCGLACCRGFVKINRELQSLSHASVFASGDCAHLVDEPLPKAGVYAVRAAPILAHNIEALLAGAPLRAVKVQRDFLKLVSLGDRSAVAERNGLRLSGRLFWQLKRAIDTRFVASLSKPP